MNPISNSQTTLGNSPVTLSSIRQNPSLWHRIHILLHDLSIPTSPPSAARLSQITHPLYISVPYFKDDEAALIRSALVSPNTTVETAIQDHLSNFLDKRRAGGSFEPCGPHDMVPVYRTVFGISKEDLKDNKFLSRMYRWGLHDAGTDADTSTTPSTKSKSSIEGKKKKKKKTTRSSQPVHTPPSSSPPSLSPCWTTGSSPPRRRRQQQ
ncbi:MAG: hypothetical protein Q9183_004720 [Haloplaca sp. 2 TL-2023]